jgi:hypothetical protein
MRRGWEAEYTDGTIITEKQVEWKNIPKVGMKRLTLYFDGRRWDINDKVAYIQKKRGSMIPGVKQSFQIEARTIGFYENNYKVLYTVSESTGEMKMEVINIV